METPLGHSPVHLPGLFEFYDLYGIFAAFIVRIRGIFTTGAPSARSTAHRLMLMGGRTGSGNYAVTAPHAVLALTREYGISARLTLSNSLLRPEHLTDPDCNALCRLFQEQ